MTESGIFVVAVKLRSPEARAAYLDEACGDNADLRRQVEDLLRLHDEKGICLEQPADAPGQTVDDVPPDEAADADPLAAEDVGTVVAGRYKLLQQIGEGGMGRVFMAEQTQPVKRMVALKVIKAGMDSKTVLARFEAERQALALMDHPNIAKVLDAGITERGHPFFVMELVKGVPLTRFCDDRQLSIGDRLRVFQQVCHAVQHAHQKGIIHRDLKPTNILVESHDGRPVPKVIDFGLAKAMTALPLTERSRFTNFGTVLGTPLYMAPEQAEFSALDVDTRADIYALGVILYELLTGTTPLEKERFAKAAWDEIRRVIKEEEPPTPSARLSSSAARASIAALRQTEPHKLGKFVRGDLDWMVMKALAKERDRRYDTANAFAADVERFLKDEPVSAGPPTVGYTLRKFVRRNRGRVTAAVVLLATLLAGVAVSTWQAVRATRAEGLARDEQGKAERNRQEADDQRKKAETQAASLAVDIDLKYCEDGDIALGLLRLARTQPTIPEHAKELRECVALNILAWGQRLRPAVPALNHDGYDVFQAILSPDGLTVLTSGQDGTARLWDSLTGKQRAILGDGNLWQMRAVQLSDDGRTALTFNRTPVARVGPDGLQGAGEPEQFDHVVRLWDVASGRLRAETGKVKAAAQSRVERMSQDQSLVVTRAVVGPSSQTISFWDAADGRLRRAVEFEGGWMSCDVAVSPDGKNVLIGHFGKVELISLEEGGPPRRLPGMSLTRDLRLFVQVAFSPSGRSAVTVSEREMQWWSTSDWRLIQEVSSPEGPKTWAADVWSIAFPREDVLVYDGHDPHSTLSWILVKGRQEPIVGNIAGQMIVLPDGTLAALDADSLYEARGGPRLLLPQGRKFHPELRRFAEDGRYAVFPKFVADLATEKKIRFEGDISPIKNPDGWIAVTPNKEINYLRKSDTSLSADVLERWCQVIARGRLDVGERFSKFDETTWERLRQELAASLETIPNAQILRSAVTDRLYWLRREIEGSSDPIPLLDRLVVAEPTWPNFKRRADWHGYQKHWDLAVRDQLEAARMAGGRYWHYGSRHEYWELGAKLVETPGRPLEQYELALRWAEATSRAGVDEGPYQFVFIKSLFHKYQATAFWGFRL